MGLLRGIKKSNEDFSRILLTHLILRKINFIWGNSVVIISFLIKYRLFFHFYVDDFLIFTVLDCHVCQLFIYCDYICMYRVQYQKANYEPISRISVYSSIFASRQHIIIIYLLLRFRYGVRVFYYYRRFENFRRFKTNFAVFVITAD